MSKSISFQRYFERLPNTALSLLKQQLHYINILSLFCFSGAFLRPLNKSEQKQCVQLPTVGLRIGENKQGGTWRQLSSKYFAPSRMYSCLYSLKQSLLFLLFLRVGGEDPVQGPGNIIINKTLMFGDNTAGRGPQALGEVTKSQLTKVVVQDLISQIYQFATLLHFKK